MSLLAQKNWKAKSLTLTIGIPESGKTYNSVLILKELLLGRSQKQKDIVKVHKK